MRPREFHIWDFPEGKIRVLFKNHKEFIDNTIKFFGSQKALGDFLGIPSIYIYYWKKHPLYIPLKQVKKIVKKCKLNWEDIEKKIISYKGINTSSPIFNPKLPIKETPEIFTLITHIICDGSVNKNGIPCYVNSSKELINNFDKILKDSFGEMNTRLSFGHGINKNCYDYRFPKITIELLKHLYNIEFYRIGVLPKEIFDLPKEFSISVIRAFGDDEGNVDLNRRVGFYSKSKELLDVLINLLREKLSFKNIGEIKEKGKNYYHFYIKSKDFEKYGKIIGFNHPEKAKLLNELVEFKNNSRAVGQHGKVKETKEKLLKLLDDNVLSTYQIMMELKINKSNINMQIRKLLSENLVIQNHKIGQTIFWTRRK